MGVALAALPFWGLLWPAPGRLFSQEVTCGGSEQALTGTPRSGHQAGHREGTWCRMAKTGGRVPGHV